MVLTAPNRLEVFVRGKHGHELVQRSWDGTQWSGWKNLGGDLADAPAVVLTAPNRLEVFVRGKHDDDLVQRSWMERSGVVGRTWVATWHPPLPSC